MLPDFLVVGFAKCGTTSIQKILERHKEIYLPRQKETQFLYLDFEYKKGMKNYEERFYPFSKGTYARVGGVEPSWAGRAARVSKHFSPETKIIFIMRNPVDFCYSLYRMEACLGVFAPDNIRPYKLSTCFEYELCKNTGDRKYNLYDRDFNGFFVNSIREYLKYFRQENMLFLFLEEFIGNELQEINRICRFLDVSEMKYIPRKVMHANENACFVKDYFAGIENVILRRGMYFLKETDICDLEYNMKYNSFKQHLLINDTGRMTKKMRRKLQEIYEPGIRDLEKLIGKDLKTLWF